MANYHMGLNTAALEVLIRLAGCASAVGAGIVPKKKRKVRDEGGRSSVGSSIERTGQSAEWYIDRGVDALPREACGSSAGTRSGAAV